MGKQKTVQELEREVETARRNFDAAARNLERVKLEHQLALAAASAAERARA